MSAACHLRSKRKGRGENVARPGFVSTQACKGFVEDRKCLEQIKTKSFACVLEQSGKSSGAFWKQQEQKWKEIPAASCHVVVLRGCERDCQEQSSVHTDFFSIEIHGQGVMAWGTPMECQRMGWDECEWKTGGCVGARNKGCKNKTSNTQQNQNVIIECLGSLHLHLGKKSHLQRDSFRDSSSGCSRSPTVNRTTALSRQCQGCFWPHSTYHASFPWLSCCVTSVEACHQHLLMDIWGWRWWTLDHCVQGGSRDVHRRQKTYLFPMCWKHISDLFIPPPKKLCVCTARCVS